MWRLSRGFCRRCSRGCFAIRWKHQEAATQKLCIEQSAGPSKAAVQQPSEWFGLHGGAISYASPTSSGDGSIIGKDTDESVVTDRFGLLALSSLPKSSVTQQTSSCEHSTADDLFLISNTTIPTIVNREGDPSVYHLQNYFERLSGDYDVSGILNDFIEADIERSDLNAIEWLSPAGDPAAAELEPDYTVQTHSGCRGLRRITSRRQKHLLSRWCVPRQLNTAKRRISRLSSSEKPRAKQSDEMDEQNGFIFLNAESGSVVAEFSRLPSEIRDSLSQNAAESKAEGITEKNAFVEMPDVKPHYEVNKSRFDPLDIRGKPASARHLRKLTAANDIEGLRATLNEYHWPHIKSVESFISDLFEVFIEKGADVDEVKLLMLDFAATNNRAYVKDSVVLSLLERIVREEGIHSATAYASQQRDLFLVKPPVEKMSSPSMKRSCDKLFRAVFEMSDGSCVSARRFVDTLVDLGYIHDDTQFILASITAQLRRDGFDRTFRQWASDVRKRRVTCGAHILMRAVLADKHMRKNRKESQLGAIISTCEEYDHPFSPLAELIVELVRADRTHDAKTLLQKLTISGRHFRTPLNRLKGDAASIVVIEKIADLVAESLLVEHRKRTPRKKNGRDVGGAAKDQSPQKAVERNDELSMDFLLAKWRSSKKPKFVPPNRKVKKHNVDPEQLHEFLWCIQKVWIDLAGLKKDISALERLCSWCAKNKVEMDERLKQRCERIRADNSPETL